MRISLISVLLWGWIAARSAEKSGLFRFLVDVSRLLTSSIRIPVSLSCWNKFGDPNRRQYKIASIKTFGLIEVHSCHFGLMLVETSSVCFHFIAQVSSAQILIALQSSCQRQCKPRMKVWGPKVRHVPITRRCLRLAAILKIVKTEGSHHSVHLVFIE